MTSPAYAAVENRMRNRLTEPGFDHCRRTAELAADLAARHGEDADVARIAGLVHDVAREMSNEELVAQAKAMGYDMLPVELSRPYLLHAAVGAGILADETGVDDSRIIQAVARHTFGAVGMTNLDKIVYLADMIEPRRRFTGVDELRVLAERDLEAAFAAGFKSRLIELIDRNQILHPRTLDVWNRLVKERGGRA